MQPKCSKAKAFDLVQMGLPCRFHWSTSVGVLRGAIVELGMSIGNSVEPLIEAAN
jgi:hypothetical protein